MKGDAGLTLWTIGHSTRSLDEFLAMLHAHEIKTLADVRRFPGSRKYPQFNRDALARSLADARIDYEPMPELGGKRHPRPDSHNDAWRNESFRAYADHMETPEFHEGIERLLQLARKERTAVLCSEAVWWRCHRSLIADYLKSSGIQVQHIMSESKSEVHPYTSAARFKEGKLSYSLADGENRPG